MVETTILQVFKNNNVFADTTCWAFWKLPIIDHIGLTEAMSAGSRANVTC